MTTVDQAAFSLRVKVIDRKDQELAIFTEKFDATKVTVGDFIKTIQKETKNSNLRKIDINRIRLTVGDPKGKALSDKRQLLSKFLTPDEIKSGSLQLVFKDLGLQISWKLVFLIEYFGPILITGLLVAFSKQIYGETKPYTFNQKLGLAMVIGHYMKREFETLFVHRFSNDTMPFFNVFKNSTHYWILMGFGAVYFLVHPKYTPPAWADDNIQMALFGAFVFFEFMNFMCHVTLRNLRKPNSSERGIPKGWGFGYVSCANYFWEALCWLTFSLSTQCLGAYLFLLVSAVQMLDWAIKKHNRYKKDFPDYPKGRKAMIPFII